MKKFVICLVGIFSATALFAQEPLQISEVGVFPLNCGATPGAARVIITPKGGTEPYMFSDDGINFQGSGDFQGITESKVIIFTVKDANNDMVSACVNTEPLEFADGLTFKLLAPCGGRDSGQVIVEISIVDAPSPNTGKETFTGTLQDENGRLINPTSSLRTGQQLWTISFDGLSAGNYTASVTSLLSQQVACQTTTF